MIDIIDILRHMAPTGQPPVDGCSVIGVGYEEAFANLRRVYIGEQFSKGKSDEKFVVGPYGSGKTHFLRQFSEMTNPEGCATCEIQLSKDIDITKQLSVYKEVVSNLKLPGGSRSGVRSLLEICMRKIRSGSPDPEAEEDFLTSWVEGLDGVDFSDKKYGRVLMKTLRALRRNDDDFAERGVMWLEGDVANKAVCKTLDESAITATEQNRFGRKAIFSLCQFLKAAGLQGTTLSFDEGEQAADVGKRKRDAILSMLRSESDAIKNVKGASVFVLYAFTPDVIKEMNKYPGLQQRISEPDPKYRFFDGNVNSPLIDLSQPYESEKETSLLFLQKIGERLVNLFCEAHGENLNLDRQEMLKASYEWAEEIDSKDQSIQKRRDMVKLTCSKLLQIYDKDRATKPDGQRHPEGEEPEGEV